ncbi:hypothetical protein ACE6H2_006681 [Prunus campanulata]
MDKSWMHADRRSKAYELGVEGFLNFASENLGNTTEIRCPCVKCGNIQLFGVGIIREHLYFNGIDQSYKIWRWHGEPWEWTTNASRNVEKDKQSRFSYVSEELGMDDNDFTNIGSDPHEFANVIGDGDEPLYPGCKIPGKNKDRIAAQLDLLNMGVKIDLQPEYGERRTRLPPGPWNLSRAEKRAVCNSFYDLRKIGHRNDQFVMASQVKQVFYVDDPMHRGWSVVLSMPNREYNDVIGDDVLGDIRIECKPFSRGIPNVDTFDDLVGEFGSENIRDGCEDIWID